MLDWLSSYWIYPSVSIAGVGFGLRNRPEALAVGSVLILVGVIAATVLNNWGFLGGVEIVVGSLVSFQAGYIAGVAMRGS